MNADIPNIMHMPTTPAPTTPLAAQLEASIAHERARRGITPTETHPVNRFLHCDHDDRLAIRPPGDHAAPVVATGSEWLRWRRIALHYIDLAAELRRVTAAEGINEGELSAQGGG